MRWVAGYCEIALHATVRASENLLAVNEGLQ